MISAGSVSVAKLGYSTNAENISSVAYSLDSDYSGNYVIGKVGSEYWLRNNLSGYAQDEDVAVNLTLTLDDGTEKKDRKVLHIRRSVMIVGDLSVESLSHGGHYVAETDQDGKYILPKGKTMCLHLKDSNNPVIGNIPDEYDMTYESGDSTIIRDRVETGSTNGRTYVGLTEGETTVTFTVKDGLSNVESLPVTIVVVAEE